MHTMKNAGSRSNPKISAPTRMGAKSVFVAPPKTAAYPRAAASGRGTPTIAATAVPRVAPMVNSGVTSPPWNPTESVMMVNSIFRIQS